MESRVDRSLKAWTRGCDDRGARISVFRHIRNIPYSLTPVMNDPAEAPEQILVHGTGSCGPKQYLLAEMFRRLGYEVAFIIVPFRWSAQQFHYPPGLRDLAADLDTAYHLSCRVSIGGYPVLVDATWDPGLKCAGFPVNETWDGLSDTACAVKPEPKNHGPAVPARTPDPAMRQRFYREFDAWLRTIRTA